MENRKNFTLICKLKDELRKLKKAEELLDNPKLEMSCDFQVWDEDQNLFEDAKVPVSTEFQIEMKYYVRKRIHEIVRILEDLEKKN